MFYNIITEQENHVITLRLNRPKQNNALDTKILEELTTFFDEISSDDELRAIIIRGNGHTFCEGADLNHLYNDETNSPHQHTILLAETLLAIRNCKVPVYAIAHGAIYGAGVGLIAAADVAIGIAGCSFCVPEVRMGLSPSTILPYIVNKMGYAKVSQYLYNAQSINASDAEKSGLISEVLSEENANTYIMKLTHHLLKASPNAIRESKRLLMAVSQEFISEQIKKMTIDSYVAIRNTDEAKEGIAAFFEKRKPQWAN
ncbi:enoyl-CoA hydratase-related protein [Bacteroidales bacterium]|nr:enoyl-CoA hydratase-related protein [Bacteroidales bacterium]